MPRLFGSSSAPGRRLLLVTAGVLALVVLAAGAARATATGSARAWDDAMLGLARTLPMQDGGRVKPMNTFARYRLLALNHRRSAKDLEGRKLEPVEWWLDAVLRPELASKYDCFRIANSEVLDAVGLSHEGKKKADRYSYDFLRPARDRIFALAADYSGQEASDRTSVEEEIISLRHSISAFEELIHWLDFGRAELVVEGSPGLQRVFEGRRSVTALEALARWEDVRGVFDEAGRRDVPKEGEGASPEEREKVKERAAALAVLERFAQDLNVVMHSAAAVAVVPPDEGAEQAAWLTPAEVLERRYFHGGASPAHVEILESLAALAKARGEPEASLRAMRTVSDRVVELADSRGEYRKIGLEVLLARLNPFGNALWAYGIAFVLLALSWAWSSRWLVRGAWALVLLGLALHVAGIAIRCVLRDRPPISTLYETILTIGAAGVIVFVVAERITRMGIALALTPVFGAFLLFFADRYEVMKGEDTMPQLQAVLDTNFWLWTHVTAINLGYMGGLLAALIAHVYVLGKAFGFQRGNPAFYRTVGTITYGTLCFGLLFSVVGTILGGVWANDSWGRFWGWDPKENGALMICLTQLAILHARMGGFLKPFGVAMATVGSGCVIWFSWLGTNLLGVGLHNYGFDGSLLRILLGVYGVEALVLGAGAWAYFAGRAGTVAAK